MARILTESADSVGSHLWLAIASTVELTRVVNEPQWTCTATNEDTQRVREQHSPFLR